MANLTVSIEFHRCSGDLAPNETGKPILSVILIP